MSFMLIEDRKGEKYVIKKTDIRRVYKGMQGNATIVFSNPKVNSPIHLDITVEDFFNINLAK